jgi:hypothetical protein
MHRLFARIAFAAATALCLSAASPAGAEDAAPGSVAAERVAATLVEIRGSVELQDGAGWVKLEEGDLLAPGDRIRTEEGASAQMVLADGSSVALGANSEMTLDALSSGAPGSVTLMTLARGLLATVVEKLKLGSTFEVRTPGSVAAVKGTDFEVALGVDGSSSVTVQGGVVQFGDAARTHMAAIHPFERRSVSGGMLSDARPLNPAEKEAFLHRWAHAHQLHAQRHELLRRFREKASARKASLERFRQRVVRRGPAAAPRRKPLRKHPKVKAPAARPRDGEERAR